MVGMVYEVRQFIRGSDKKKGLYQLQLDEFQVISRYFHSKPIHHLVN